MNRLPTFDVRFVENVLVGVLGSDAMTDNRYPVASNSRSQSEH